MEPVTADEIVRGLAARALEVGDAEGRALAGFVNLLEQWNRVHNLTGIRDRAGLVDRHLVESLALKPFIKGTTAADIGSGGGLPGLPLAICLPAVAFTLIESRRKRVGFLRHAAATLGLANVSVAHGRVEALDLPTFATVLARAVAPPARLLDLARPLVADGGRLVLLTGADRVGEVMAAARDFEPVPVGAPLPGLASRVVVLERKFPEAPTVR